MIKNGEIINLYVGQGGCQIGTAIWEMYCMEHSVRRDGVCCPNRDHGNLSISFASAGADKMVPRASFIDLEPEVVDEIRIGPFRHLFNPKYLITGKEDASNCFARGYFNTGRDILDLVLNRIRNMAEECGNLQGFLFHRTYSGGTGSGFMSRLLDSLSNDYNKKTKFEFALYPAPNLSSVVVESYNTALAAHQSLEHLNGVFVMDNEALYDISDRLLDQCTPSLNDINRLLGQLIALTTSPLRFEGVLNVNLNDIQTNLIPFPRIQHALISYAPLLSKNQLAHENLSESWLLSSCFEPSNQTAKLDTRKGKYMACTVLFRGDINSAVVNSGISSVQAKRYVNFVEWSPTGFKVGISNMPRIIAPGKELFEIEKSCLMLANSTAVKTVVARVCRKFDMMFSKKAFLHWYLSEGLEESDFLDTRLDLAALESDYLEIETEN